jgi:putative ABC transport system ATP-binding protein
MRRARGTDAVGGTAAGVAVSLRAVTKVYGRGRTATRALDGIDVEFCASTFTAVMGPSGSGKSTLLQCAAGLDRPTSGAVWLAGAELSGYSEAALTRLRRTRIGFVFQAYNLVPALTVRENMLLPARLAGIKWNRRQVDELAGCVGLEGRLRHRPSELSGGEQQRAAIARALLARPEVIFCDEPTGALDSTSATRVLGLLRHGVDEDGRAVVMVTHDPKAASFADRVVYLADGTIVDELVSPNVETITDRLARLSSAPPAVIGTRP